MPTGLRRLLEHLDIAPAEIAFRPAEAVGDDLVGLGDALGAPHIGARVEIGGFEFSLGLLDAHLTVLRRPGQLGLPMLLGRVNAVGRVADQEDAHQDDRRQDWR